MCDSFLGEGKVEVYELSGLHGVETPPCLCAHFPATPLPWEGIKNDMLNCFITPINLSPWKTALK
ncbi:hypothetical protein SAMN05428947_101782 [Mucilaginibacter sp. OK283]|jgi:hypothetical protein|nr:hypothetical protein SAMN05428947_101782 [Mucilaginibacter sp. OK283]